jgi:hypothetical protein
MAAGRTLGAQLVSVADDVTEAGRALHASVKAKEQNRNNALLAGTDGKPYRVQEKGKFRLFLHKI